MTAIRLTLLALLMINLTGMAFAANDDIRFISKAEIEVPEVDASGAKVLVRQPATLVVPGANVIYTNSFTNHGTETAENLVITNPVPDRMEFLAGSTLPETAVMTYSIDGGKTFAVPDQLLITEVDGSKRVAEAKEYTHIRWLVKDQLLVGATGQVEFRARLK